MGRTRTCVSAASYAYALKKVRVKIPPRQLVNSLLSVVPWIVMLIFVACKADRGRDLVARAKPQSCVAIPLSVRIALERRFGFRVATKVESESYTASFT